MRWLVLVSVVSLLVACSGQTPPTAPTTPSAAPTSAGQSASARTTSADAAAELGRRFVQALVSGDANGANALLADSARSGLGAEIPAYARALAACAGSSLDVSASQDQSMTNVLAQFVPPCGRFGDIAPLLDPGAAEPADAEKKVGGCLVALQSANSAPRVVNVACIPE